MSLFVRTLARIHAAAVFAACLARIVAPQVVEAAWLPDGTPICTTPEAQTTPFVITDGSGGAIFVWRDTRTGIAGIYGQRVDSNGVAQWAPDGLLLQSSANSADSPVALPFLGGAVVVWSEYVAPGNVELVAQRIDLSGNRLWGAGGIPITQSADTDEDAVLIGNGSSGAFDPIGFYVAWRRYDYLTAYEDGHTVLVKAIDSAGNSIWPGGEIVLSSPIPSQRSAPVIALDGTATVGRARSVVVAWHDNESITSTDILADRVTTSGVRSWTYPANVVCDESYGQSDPAIATVGTQTVVVWTDNRFVFSTRVYAQRQSSSGGKLWAADGIPVCTASTSQFDPCVIADNAGGVIVAWVDQRSGVSQPYAQRLDVNGSPQWSASAVPLCTAATGVSGLRMVPDGAGGAIVSWYEPRSGQNDVYVQRIDADGHLVWNAAGLPLCNAGGHQYLGGLVRSGTSGAIVGWLDQRNGASNGDVYANRVEAGGGVADVVPSPAGPGALALESRNPASGPVRLRLALAEPADVTADVLDVSGRRVRTDLARASLGAGTHTLSWDGTDDRGQRVRPGVYLVRVSAGTRRWTARVVQL